MTTQSTALRVRTLLMRQASRMWWESISKQSTSPRNTRTAFSQIFSKNILPAGHPIQTSSATLKSNSVPSLIMPCAWGQIGLPPDTMPAYSGPKALTVRRSSSAALILAKTRAIFFIASVRNRLPACSSLLAICLKQTCGELRKKSACLTPRKKTPLASVLSANDRSVNF